MRKLLRFLSLPLQSAWDGWRSQLAAFGYSTPECVHTSDSRRVMICLTLSVNGEGPYRSAHLSCLIKALTVCMKNMSKYPDLSAVLSRLIGVLTIFT